ncbi:unnamed protein product [Blepharisma stoltei]|uniref:FAM13A-like domain-containing protein n=1 Tax=Blepharisma stoltei TaxID=1481888 RepID=A0AAU9IX05_9CILI|nr:unnamed protein product [Blepharisma stoltei]
MEYDILNEILTSTVSSLFEWKNPGMEEQMRSSLASLPPPNSSDWVKVEGNQKLEMALRRLRIDRNTTNGRELNNKTTDELNTEKKKVKNELKAYDTTFKSLFGRLPKREEKEPMRPLYMYYKKIKQAISKRPAEKGNKKLNRDEVARKLETLRKERSELKAILHNFQLEFSQTNQRKIRYHKDILPVENEYKRYKEVKAEIAKLDSELSKA